MGRGVKTEEEVEVVVIEDVEGVGREAQQGGEVPPSGGTEFSLAGAAPTLEVQHAIQHAVDVSQGRALPANTTIIAPLAPPLQATSSLLDPGPSGALAPRVRRAIAQACVEARGGLTPQHHSPRSARSVPLPTPQAPVQLPTVPVRSATGASAGPATTEPPLPQQRLLSQVPPQSRGARWHLRQKPYVPWTPSQAQLWEACCLLTGEGEWTAPRAVFVPEGDPQPAGARSSMRWVCGYDSCQKLLSSQFDGRGHFQSTHLCGLHTSPLCSCGLTFNSCSMLANHLDIQHNVHHAGVSRRSPVVYLIYIDRVALPPTTGPSPTKRKRKQ